MTNTVEPVAVADPAEGPAAWAASADLCRLTVIGPAGRVDLAVPVSARFGGLFALLAAHVGGAAEPGRAWLLQRLGEEPLHPDDTPLAAGLDDGTVLHLRPAEEPIPPLRYDDLPDGVADAVRARGDRWTPESTRALLLTLAGVALAALAVALVFGSGPRALLGLVAGIGGVLLTVAAALFGRLLGQRGVGLVLGLGGTGFGALAGLLAVRGPAELLATSAPGVLLAGVCAGALALAAAIATCVRADGPLAAYGTATLTAWTAALSAWLVTGWQLSGVDAASVVAVVLFLVGSFAPRLAARLARLRVPLLPRTAEELQVDIDPEPADVVAVRTGRADAFLAALVITGALLFAVDAVLLARVPEWIGWVLPALFAVAVLLRSRSLHAIGQRGALAVVGGVGLAATLLRFALADSPSDRIGLLAVLLVVTVLLALAAWRLPVTRLLPIWGHSADLAELWTAIALIPLLLQLLGVYEFFRSLAG